MQPPTNAAGREGPASASKDKTGTKVGSSEAGGKPALVDISERIKAANFGRDEVILFPVKELKVGGPAFFGIIRLTDGRRFSAGLWKHPRRHQLRLRLRTKTPSEGDPQAICFVEPVKVKSGESSAHYRSAFWLDGKIYSVRLWVRSYGERKVLEVKLTSTVEG